MTPQQACESVHRKVSRRLLAANIIGAVAVFSYLRLASESYREYALAGQIVLVAAQLVVLCPLAILWGHARFERTVRWIREDRSIRDDERVAVLREPWKQALRPMVPWMIAAASWAAVAIAAGEGTRSVVRIFDGIALGGLTTCALSFLLIESAFRPLFALALAGAPPRRPSTLGVRPRLLLAWGAGSGVPLIGLVMNAMEGESASTGAIVVLAGFGVVGGLLAIVVTAHSLAEPLDALRDAMARVRDGELDVGVPVDDGGEIGEVQEGFNRMVHGLRERDRLADLFGRHVGEEVAQQALVVGSGLGGEQREASAIFVDLIGSTAMAEVLPAVEVVATLNDFFDIVVGTVAHEGGWVNKFEGDGALCVFGVPALQPDHAARALRAARRLSTELHRLAERHPGVQAGIGVSSGSVVAGNVGTEERYEYTVIGPAVNVAARLTDIAKGRRVKVLASGASIERAGPEATNWSSVGTVAVRGMQAPTAIFEPRVGVLARP